MGDFTTKIQTHIATALEPGEEVLAAASAGPKGTMQAMAHGDGGMRRRRIGSPRLAAGRAELEIFGVAAALQYVVVLTDRRFVFFRTTMFGRPKKLAGALDRGEIDSLTLGGAIALGQRYGELRFVRRDGRRATLEVARVQLPRAAALVARFTGAAAA
jgi:hypothetical protein